MLELLKLEVDQKLKLEKLKIEFRMLFVLQELQLNKESLLEEDVLFFMLQEP